MMFLALKEMRYSKLRYSLIIGIMFLIAYVVFILSGLATGLNWEFKQVIVDWDAQTIVLSEDANDTFAASQLTRGDIERVKAENKASIGLYSSVVIGDGEKINTSIFGTEEDAFLLPKVIKGRSFTAENEIIISKNLAEEGFEVGDQIKIGRSEEKMTIVGIFPETFYTVTPVVYTSLDTWTKLKYNNQPFASDDEKPINIVVAKEANTTLDNTTGTELSQLTTEDFIENLPGFSAQNLTLNSMIYFLFVIATAIVGIFMYVITLQKTAIFGVMKAQGIRTSFIAKSIIGQSFIVGLIGVFLAFAAAYGTSLILPSAMPFAFDLMQWFLYSGILIVVAVLGGLFSIRTVTKVDPISAIGG